MLTSRLLLVWMTLFLIFSSLCSWSTTKVSNLFLSLLLVDYQGLSSILLSNGPLLIIVMEAFSLFFLRKNQETILYPSPFIPLSVENIYIYTYTKQPKKIGVHRKVNSSGFMKRPLHVENMMYIFYLKQFEVKKKTHKICYDGYC